MGNYGIDTTALVSSVCRDSFEEYVKEFWPYVSGAGKLKWNWHLSYFCDTLQEIAERVFKGLPKKHDLALNVSPGTSKSSIFSILFPTWIWTRMPEARILTASHTDTLALDLANKSRMVVKSEHYRKLFPELKLSETQDTKSYYVNTKGGDRLTCTVSGKSPMGFHAHFLIVDDPLDPKKVLSEVELKIARDFVCDVIPTRKVDKAVAVTLLVMQRLGLGDCTDVMIEEAKKPGAAKVKHVCLPAELDPEDPNIEPPELAKYYVNGCMDPYRLSREVLLEFKARGALYYSTQFMQKPYARMGGMFQEAYFNQRVKAAPYATKRIRYWDRAATQDGGCRTAGVLLAYDGNNYYIENVVMGQWEPDARNQQMRATALRDRSRYGPKYEPTIYIEREGGSSGRDAWKSVARALRGFRVVEDTVTGSKETRAEPWSAQLAARNVYLVEDGTWDINDYIQEHCAFPLGKFKDQVDASTGAFNLLVSQTTRTGGFRIFSKEDHNPNKKNPKILVCDRDALANLLLDEPVVLITFRNPDDEETPFHVLGKVLGSSVLYTPDIQPEDFQEDWLSLVPPYDKPPADLVMTREQGKKIWSLIMKKWDTPLKVIVFQDDGDKRAISAAYAVEDTLGWKNSITWVGKEGWKRPDKEPAPNRHVAEVVRSTRVLVV